MKTIFMIGNAHIDPVWLWRWPEGFSEVLSTCRTAVELLKKYDELVFTRGEAITYRWIEQADPKLFNEIKVLVKEGRWKIVNGWWIQPDCNIPNGESFVRQSLYGKSYFKKKFGIDVEVGYCVDSFGHAASLPQILSKSGFKYYVFMRPGPNEKELPTIFRWRAPDDSEVIAFRIVNSYATHSGDLAFHIEQTINAIPEDIQAGMCFYGVGNHGGGPTEEQISFILKNKKFNSQTVLKFGSPQDFFEEVKSISSTLPIIKDELQYHAIGCFSTGSKLKLLNRKSENSLRIAEKWATIAKMTLGVDYPYKQFENLWKSLLFNQFHDTLGATTVKEAYEDALNDLCGIISQAERIIYESLQKIAQNINTSGEGISFIVFNSLPFWRTEYIEYEPWIGREEWGERILVDSFGEEIPYEKIIPSAAKMNVHRICFKADVPPCGYKTFLLKKEKSKVQPINSLKIANNIMENNYYKLCLNNEGRSFTLYNKTTESQLLEKGSNKFLIIDDKSDTWSHGISHYTREGEEVSNTEIKINHSGNLKSVLSISSYYGRSKIVQDITMFSDSPVIKSHFFIDWHEKHKVLKLVFKFSQNCKLFSEIPFGVIERDANGQEFPMQRGIFLQTAAGDGIAFANNGKYAYDMLGNEIRFTILRNPPYAWHDPYKLEEKRSYYYIDEGIQEFDLWFWAFSKENKNQNVNIFQSLNEPMAIINVDNHLGKLKPIFSFVEIEGKNVSLETIKMAEDKSKSIIMRLWETAGEKSSCLLRWGEKENIICFNPFEIKTIKLNSDGIKETNFMES